MFLIWYTQHVAKKDTFSHKALINHCPYNSTRVQLTNKPKSVEVTGINNLNLITEFQMIISHAPC